MQVNLLKYHVLKTEEVPTPKMLIYDSNRSKVARPDRVFGGEGVYEAVEVDYELGHRGEVMIILKIYALIIL